MSWRAHVQLKAFKLETQENTQAKQSSTPNLPTGREFANPSSTPDSMTKVRSLGLGLQTTHLSKPSLTLLSWPLHKVDTNRCTLN